MQPREQARSGAILVRPERKFAASECRSSDNRRGPMWSWSQILVNGTVMNTEVGTRALQVISVHVSHMEDENQLFSCLQVVIR